MTEALARDVAKTDSVVELSVALHLTVRGTRAEVADVIARRWLANPDSLHLARLLFTREDNEASGQHADLALICRALGAVSTTAPVSYERIVELSPEQADARARRQGWAAAVLGRGLDECPTDGVSAQAWRAGFTDFTDTFGRFMEGR